MFALHETCLEYFRRRLSEGWECISLEGHNAVLLSPEGFRREIDLRNDVETLRPNAAGDYTNIASQFPVDGEHWDKVDEAIPDDDATNVYTASAVQQKDAYGLQDTAIPGDSTINSVKAYFRIRGLAQPFLRLAGAETQGAKAGTESPSYGDDIAAIAIDDTHIYVGGYTTNTVRKYLKSDLSYIGQTADYGDTILAIAIDNTHIYVGGATTRTVRKYLKSDLSYIDETASYGGDIYAIAIDDTHIYAGGFTTQTVRKYLKSDLSYIDEAASYGGTIRAIVIDDTHIYAGGDTTQTVRKYLKSDLSYIDETASYGGTIYAIAIDDTHIYVGGATTDAVRKYLKSDLSYIDEAASYGDDIYAIAIDDTHIYAGGDTTNTVRKYLKSDLSYIGETASYGDYIEVIVIDDTHIYVGGATTTTVRKYLKSDLSQWLTFSEFLARPGGGEWAVADLDGLQAVVGLEVPAANNAYCTQLYIEVDYAYTPILTTNAATGITPASAILNGTLNEDLGEVWDARFQWGKTEDYGNNTPWQAGFSEGDTFSQLINTLEPGTLYHFRAQVQTLALGTLSGADVAFWTLKPSVGKAYAFSRELHIKRATDVVDKASIAASAITTLADCKGINLVEVPSSLTLTVEATYDALATQGIKVHVRTSLTDRAVGAHTGADGAAALTDAEAHFVVDELIGLTIKNLTDGSSGIITANTATGVTATLAGGTNNDWDAGDVYIIEGAGYDTEDWDSFAPAFGAGSSIRQTEHYDVDPVHLKVLVENLDPAEEVTDVCVIVAIGS